MTPAPSPAPPEPLVRAGIPAGGDARHQPWGGARALGRAAEPDIGARRSPPCSRSVATLIRAELLRYTLTGAYAFGDARGRRPVDEDGIARFARANADLVGAGQSLVGRQSRSRQGRSPHRRSARAHAPAARRALSGSRPAATCERRSFSFTGAEIERSLHREPEARSGRPGRRAGRSDVHRGGRESRRSGGRATVLGARRGLGRLLRVSGHLVGRPAVTPGHLGGRAPSAPWRHAPAGSRRPRPR